MDEGSGQSGSGLMPPDITCSQIPLTFTAEIFTPLSMLIESLECQSTSSMPLLFVLDFADRQEMLTPQRASNSFVADLLERGGNSINITVCFQQTGNSTVCDPDFTTTNLGIISISVQSSTSRLFPYDSLTRLTGDRSFRGVLDGAVPIYPTDSIPFYSTYYRRLYVSFNRVEL